jgi:GntR family transcriptional regulator, carbon starvation induced regulator
MQSTPMTRSEWVDAQLRRAILHGELAPGEKLRAEHLAQQFGVSPTPLRETFMRLAGEGLVVVEPQRGARVAPLDVAEATEVYEVRLLLDPVALERAIREVCATHTLDQYARQVEAAHAVLAAPAATVGAFHDAHRSFHLALVAPCPNRRLLRQVIHLLDQSQRFHALGASSARRSDPAIEHQQLAEAAMVGDHQRAVSLIMEHLRATLEAVRQSSMNS